MRLHEFRRAVAALMIAGFLSAPRGDVLAYGCGGGMPCLAIGAEMADSSTGLGAVVTNIVPSGPFEKARVEAGDTILAANGRVVMNVAEFYSIINSAPTGSELTVSLKNGRTGLVTTTRVTLSS